MIVVLPNVIIQLGYPKIAEEKLKELLARFRITHRYVWNRLEEFGLEKLDENYDPNDPSYDYYLQF